MIQNRISGLVVALFGILILIWFIPQQTETADATWLTPATLPAITAVIMIISSLIQIIFPAGKNDFDLKLSLRAGLFLLLTVASLFLIIKLGFIYTAPVMMAVLMFMVGERRPVWLITGILLTPFTIWWVVESLLRRPLP